MSSPPDEEKFPRFSLFTHHQIQLFCGYTCSSAFRVNQLPRGYACSSTRPAVQKKYPHFSSFTHRQNQLFLRLRLLISIQSKSTPARLRLLINPPHSSRKVSPLLLIFSPRNSRLIPPQMPISPRALCRFAFLRKKKKHIL